MKIRNIGISLVMVLGLVLPMVSSAAGETGTVQTVTVYNETKNKDATLQSADKEDFLTFTLTVKNNSTSAISNYSPIVNLSYVLDFADMVDKGGATLSGSILTYPSMSIPSGSSITKSFKVRVKYFLPVNNLSNMTVTFGNTVTVLISRPSITMSQITTTGFNDNQVKGATTVVKTAPKTGADMNAIWFGLALALSYGLFKHRKSVLTLLSK